MQLCMHGCLHPFPFKVLLFFTEERSDEETCDVRPVVAHKGIESDADNQTTDDARGEKSCTTGRRVWYNAAHNQ